MSRQTQKKRADDGAGFIRKTVTLPDEVAEFADSQAAKPEHAGNVSSYVRSLILQDRENSSAGKKAA